MNDRYIQAYDSEGIRREMLEHLDRLSHEDLRVVVHAARTRLHHLDEVQSRIALQHYAPGDRVVFEHNGRMLPGIVERVNVKTVSIKTPEGDWRVAPCFLHRCRDGEG